MIPFRKRTAPPPRVKQPSPDLLAYATLMDERDRARAFAVTLEQENARVLHVLTTQVIPDADPTSAYLCGVRDGYQTATGFAIELLTEVPA